MTRPDRAGATLSHLDESTRALIRLAASLAAGSEADIRRQLQLASASTPAVWIEELILQTYLFAGFPRALNGMREWRRLHPKAAAPSETVTPDAARSRGEKTCSTVYGSMYEKLRVNIRALHPALDEWMIVEGYGKVLSRPELDLPRRELCIVAACAAAGQDRQLQSHLHGALNAGVSAGTITESLEALADVVSGELLARASGLWQRIRHDIH
jgi:4-carboxymuconolactone decarboxylase